VTFDTSFYPTAAQQVRDIIIDGGIFSRLCGGCMAALIASSLSSP
jgi:hypothetical protein